MRKNLQIKNLTITLLYCFGGFVIHAQDTIRYTGNTLVNADYHHGQLQPVVGVHSIQLLRANREHPEMAEGNGFTYNHAPMLAYWNNRFYVEYLSDSIGESVPPGQTLLTNSTNGNYWSKPVIIFPKYKIPDGTTKEGHPGVAKNLYAVMHQRMGFYTSKSNKLLVLGFYGICLDAKDDPNDGNGIGRVVREVKADGTFGPIYFLHYNHLWNEKNTDYPFYSTSNDKGFIQACNELMSTPLMMMQWAEEADRNDPLIPLKKNYKAFNYYHLPDGRVVGLWKNALTAISNDNGKSWPENATRAPKFVNSNAKFWGQRSSDGQYAIVYNPSEFRWPLAISTSKNGLDYHNLLLVNGEISTMRYGGNYKSYGPQYVRGIIEGNGTPPDGNMWVTYSMNKEDIWVSSIPVPVMDKVNKDVTDNFSKMPDGAELKDWNTFSPAWAPVAVERYNGIKCLSLKDWDRYDYAKAERIVPAAKKMNAEFSLTSAQNNTGMLDIEFQDAKGTAGIRITFDSAGSVLTKAGARYKNIMKYHAGEKYDFKIQLDADSRVYTINVNGKDVLKAALLFVPVETISRIVFRTGPVRRYPDIESMPDQDFDVPDPGDAVNKAAFFIYNLETQKIR